MTQKMVRCMDAKCIFCALCTCFILKFGETASRNMAPRITEPLNNINVQVEQDSKIDLCCSAILRCNTSIEGTIIYWLINGEFPESYENVQESNQSVTKNGDLTYIYKTLHIYKVVPERYNIPITCVAQSTSGLDNSTLYLRTFKTGQLQWAVIIPLFLVLCLLTASAYKYYRAEVNDEYETNTWHEDIKNKFIVDKNCIYLEEMDCQEKMPLVCIVH